ncbi:MULTISPECIES: hypothetical protein [Mycolicibacterium]|jgi:hypothetical protein|uniref:Uncharacterized protein n=3 Tax=Mycolicibacterium TaxID=1866885 RepID=A0A132PED2_9MYCO|nr:MULTISPECIES: hypothetical protein [Mycolicibacterium]KLI04815.1 hypothetical protein AA982_27965 [Mycolicibacterium senegalense]KLO47473.1 hypothetical protein ABW05_32465 [Mycolicibacterium senegalense]KWX20681.1 hypothetical protein AFM11_29075 [Mycolicibacterium wolinskyi]
MTRDNAYWEGTSRVVEAGECQVVGPLELGPAAAARLRLSRITLYTPAQVMQHVAAAYAAVLNAGPVVRLSGMRSCRPRDRNRRATKFAGEQGVAAGE